MALRSPEREVVPTVLLAEDPYAGDESLYDEGDAGNAIRFGSTLPPEEYTKVDRRFHEAYLETLSGSRAWGDPLIGELAIALGIAWPRVNDRRPAREAEMVLPDHFLAEVVEDLVPDALCVVERITGNDGPPPLGALAALAFVGCAADGRRPFDFWQEDEGTRPPVRAGRIIDLSPPCVYVDGVPILPIAAKLTPTGPAPAPVCVARAYRVADGWAWSCVVPLPAVPDAAVLLRRLELEILRIRRQERRSTFEDVLRRRPEVVYRAAAEGAARRS